MKFEWKAENREGAVIAQGTTEFEKGEMHIQADLPSCVIGKVAGDLEISVSQNEKIFMNGYQTWTVSEEHGVNGKIRGVDQIPALLNRKYAFDRYGDYHFVKYPNRKGVLHGFSWCTLRRGGFYRLIGSLNERNGYTMLTLNTKENILHIEKDCSGVRAGGETALFDLFYAEGTEDEVYDAWFNALGIHPLTEDKIAGYSSWYNRYEDISEQSILEDLEGCRKIFRKGDLFQVDDGWEQGVGDWDCDTEKFPSGMKVIADRIHESGFRAGLWLAPFAVRIESKTAKEHPDWILKHDGKPWVCGGNWGGFYALDIDHPEVVQHLENVFHTVTEEWGYDLVKLDFLYAAAIFGTDTESRAGRMYRGMELLRKWCGETLILGCGVPVMPAFGMVEYCRIGCDVTLDWDDVLYMRAFHRERPSTKNSLVNTLNRRPLNGRAFLSDPDVFFLRNENIRLSEEEKTMLGEMNALMGGVFLTSDNPSSYTPEMIRRYNELRRLTAESDVHVRHMKNGSERSRFAKILENHR